jgi:serine/threonine-protein kinase
MFEDSEIPPVGLEDEAAFKASMVFGADGDDVGDETIVLPQGQGAGQPEVPEGKQPGWVGKTLGHFKLLRLIAEGSMGIVIQAMDVNLHRIVALKVLRKRIVGFDDRQRVDQFLREARAAARLDHPNVVRIYEINEHGGWWYIAMEMVEGGSVKQIIKAAGGMPPGRACPVIADAAVALAAAHSLGIIHRDMKPGNLMVTRGGHCKLTDFGLVRLYDPNDPFDFTTRAVGTPQFVAPEVIRDHRSASASDVYSLGGTLYYALTGHPPYVGAKVAEILNQHLDGPLPELSKYMPDCPQSLNKLVHWAMAKDPAQRPVAADFAAALRSEAIDWRGDDSGTVSESGSGSSLFGHITPVAGSHTASGSVVPKPVAARTAGSRRTWITIGCGVAVLLAVLVLWMLFGPRGPAGGPAGGQVTDITGRFPDSPATYGVLAPGAIPTPELPAPPPASFSWVGKHDTTGLRFVASKRGRYYYPISHPTAQLIRSEDFVGYKSVDEAGADGKIPIQ